MEKQREKLGSRLGFILLSAGCAIGCGNVWKFPWLCGQGGGGAFVLLYLIFLVILGLPVMTMELSLGRASQASPVRMYQKLEKPGQKWHIHGWVSLAANVILMMFYTVVAGWMLYYLYRFVVGTNATVTFAGAPDSMLSLPGVNVGFMVIVVVLAFAVLAVGLQKGLERITKYMMVALFVLMLGLAVYACCQPNAGEGLSFYLIPDVTKINANVVVSAMNQAFFTLSLGIGSMAIFGSYIDKERSLLGESVNIICLDTLVALVAGLIIFPACFSAGVEPDAGPGLLFSTMAGVFNGMGDVGRFVGALFFLFMVFAAFSTVLAVCENILACVMELTGWSRPLTAAVCGAGLLLLSIPCALGFNVWSGFQPLGAGTSVQDLEDFIVSYCVLPLGSLCYVLFCTTKFGFGWDNFVEEANTGKGLKVQKWMRGYMTYGLPAIIGVLFVIGLLSYFHIITL